MGQSWYEWYNSECQIWKSMGQSWYEWYKYTYQNLGWVLPLQYFPSTIRCVPGRTMCMCSPSRKTDNVNALVVPSRTMWMIKLPWFKNPISIINKIGGDAIWRQNLALYEISTIKHVNDKLAIGWSTCRCQDFKHMHVAELRVPGKTMCAFIHIVLLGTRRIVKFEGIRALQVRMCLNGGLSTLWEGVEKDEEFYTALSVFHL